MKPAFRCVRCGTTYPVEHSNDWGKHADSAGYGPQPVCTALVPLLTPEEARTTPQSVCRGQLYVVSIADEQAAKLPPVRPIDATPPAR